MNAEKVGEVVDVVKVVLGYAFLLPLLPSRPRPFLPNAVTVHAGSGMFALAGALWFILENSPRARRY